MRVIYSQVERRRCKKVLNLRSRSKLGPDRTRSHNYAVDQLLYDLRLGSNDCLVPTLLQDGRCCQRRPEQYSEVYC